MKVKIIKDYTDLELNELVGKGTILDVSEERGKILIEAEVAVLSKIENNEEKTNKKQQQKNQSEENEDNSENNEEKDNK